MGIIGSACVLLINACETIAQGMGIAPYFIAVILASAATSLPDTILSYKDAIKGDYDDAIANALGSNIFDVCFAMSIFVCLSCLFLSIFSLPSYIIGWF